MAGGWWGIDHTKARKGKEPSVIYELFEGNSNFYICIISARLVHFGRPQKGFSIQKVAQ